MSLANDNFNRADGALGQAPSGQTWTNIAGAGWTLLSGAADCDPNTSAGMVVLSSAQARNVTVQATILEVTAGSGSSAWGLLFCYIDTNNWYRVAYDATVGNFLRLASNIAGVVVDTYAPAHVYTPANNDVIAVSLCHGRVVVSVNGTELYNVTDPALNTLTSPNTGLMCGAGPASPHVRWDDYTVVTTVNCFDGCCPTNVYDITTGFGPIVYDPVVQQNVIEVGGELFRNGGVVGTNDAYAEQLEWIDGDGCATWIWTVENSIDDHESNELLYYIFPEDGSVGAYGWYFTNNIVSFRRSPILNSGFSFPIYYRNFDLGFNRFAIYYNNGTLQLLETNEFYTADPGWIGPPSYAAGGLPTTTRWRLKVQTRAAPLLGHSSAVSQYIGSASPCGQANWVLPPLGWSAESMATQPPGLATQRFDSGVGPTPYYIIPQLSDSGDELRAKSLKSLHVTGKLTNAVGMAYGYDVGENIEIADLESGENSKTGPIEIPDTTEVTLTERRQIRVPNAELHTVRIEGEWDGEGELDRIDEIAYEYAEKGVRR